MTHDRTAITRRNFTGLIIGSATALAACGRGVAQDALTPTIDATEGPFFPVSLPADSDADLTRIAGHSERAAGQVIEVRGRVLDRYGNPVPGARLRLWQANAAGRYAHPDDPAERPLDPNFQGYADLRTDEEGGWRIVTVKPGAYDSPVGRRTPHIHGKIASAGPELTTQMYFDDEAESNARDNLYRRAGDRAPTAIAHSDPAQAGIYNWDVVLGG